MDVDGPIQEFHDESTPPECNDENGVLEALDVEGLVMSVCDSDSDESDSDSDNIEFDRSLDNDDEREILEDAE